MRWSRLSVALASVAIVGCGPRDLTLQQRVVEEASVGERVTDWTTALNNRESEDLQGMYENSPTLDVVWPDGRRVMGFEEQQQAIEDFFDSVEQLNFLVQSPDVEILAPRVALVSFRHSMDVRFVDNRRELGSGHGTLVWIKSETDDVWRIQRQHLSVMPPRQ